MATLPPTRLPPGTPVRAEPRLPQLTVARLHTAAKLPTRATAQALGFDVYAFLLSESGRPNTALIPPRSTRVIPTGLVVMAPPGFGLFICSRSGLAVSSVFIANAPGVIDPDYTGELKMLVYNGSHESYYVRHEDRIGQIVPLPIVSFGEILDKLPAELPTTERGAAGVGSTGR